MPSTSTDRLSGLTTSLAVKPAVQAITSANITLSGLTQPTLTLGSGIAAIAEGTRILVKDQTDTTENGIYLASTSDWTRAKDFDGNRDAVNGTLVVFPISIGNGALYQVESAANPIVIGASAITFSLRDNPNVTYQITQAEIDAGVVPVNYGYPAGNPRRQGAPTDGTASARSALSTQNSTGEQIYLTAGTYLVDSNLTLSSAIWAESGAIFKVANGVTLDITGAFDGSKTAHFQLVGTGKVRFGTAANQTTYVPIPPLCPEYWGAEGVNGNGDDTAAVQACVDYLQTAGREIVFLQDYPVSQIVLTGNGLNIDFNNFNLVGISTVATKSVLDIKCGYSTLTNVRADADFNPLYECAIHWYTNDVNLYYPGFNRIYGMWPRNALIGLCIGSLPSQSIPQPASGTVQAAGIATNAPLSESSISGFQTISCVRGIWMTQANGKIQISEGVVNGSHTGWTTYGASGYTDASTCALVIRNDSTQSSELHLSGGSILQNSESAGSFINVTHGYLHCSGTIIEAQSSSYLAGACGVTFSQCMNMGWNFTGDYSPFLIDTNASGSLRFSDLTIAYSGGNLTGTKPPFVKGASDVSGTYSTNLKGFTVTFDNVELRDIPVSPLTGTSSYRPSIQGVQAYYSQSKYTSYTAGVITTQYDVSDSTDLLSNVVDQPNYIVTAYGANGNATSGGWTFAVAGSSQWGSAASGITQLERVIDKCLKLFGAVGGSATATSPMFPIVPQHPYLLRGWISGGVTGATIAIQINWFKFDDAASATTSTTLLNAADTAIGGTALPFQFMCVPPKDATQGQVVLSAQNGATMQITDISLR